MTGESIYAGLPAEFRSPHWAAQRIAALDTLAGREAYFGRIPPGWQAQVLFHAIIDIAARIVAAPGLPARERALLEVPAAWVPEVKAHVRRLWPRREELRTEV
jgi:hypothetical protein